MVIKGPCNSRSQYLFISHFGLGLNSATFQTDEWVTDPKLIKQCIEECEARIEIGLHYNIPYPRPIHLPPMGLAHKQGRTLRHQEKLRKISKPIYLKSHDEVS
ncbi:LYR motif-containing protein 1 isoform X2 [Rissa tridactyla]|uniref:LYR motif-containing protein 1 isoform X2 n=1 Tax=Rissa tridactyla TaxID=75485 RepID=UPI0023BAC15D|nr:LYR motif-containing protein 1 isoform X2 [Rissa tridactyla]